MATRHREKIIIFLGKGTLVLLFLMPFHAFFTTWLGTLFGFREIFQAWKEGLLLIMSLAACWLIFKDQSLRRHLFSWRINQLILAYSILHIVIALVAVAFFSHLRFGLAVFGLKYNLSFLIFFVLAQTASYYFREKRIVQKSIKIVLGTGIAVMFFGVLQGLFLPKDFLTIFGYGSDTVIPYLPLNIDADSETVRILSTIGGPIQLGVFLILPFSIALQYALQKNTLISWALVIGFVLTEFFTYSRGPWLGMALAAAIIIMQKIGKKKSLVISGIAAAIMIFSGIFVVANIQSSEFLQTTILHSTTDRLSWDSSNSIRLNIIREAAKTAMRNPLGIGPGTVGPASHFLSAQKVLQENYYLQIAIEVGFLGLGIFLAISYLTARRLFFLFKTQKISIPLLASFLGIMLVNMFTHWGWADSSTALVWWGLAGLVIRHHDPAQAE